MCVCPRENKRGRESQSGKSHVIKPREQQKSLSRCLFLPSVCECSVYTRARARTCMYIRIQVYIRALPRSRSVGQISSLSGARRVFCFCTQRVEIDLLGASPLATFFCACVRATESRFYGCRASCVRARKREESHEKGREICMCIFDPRGEGWERSVIGLDFLLLTARASTLFATARASGDKNLFSRCVEVGYVSLPSGGYQSARKFGWMGQPRLPIDCWLDKLFAKTPRDFSLLWSACNIVFKTLTK